MWVLIMLGCFSDVAVLSNYLKSSKTQNKNSDCWLKFALDDGVQVYIFIYFINIIILLLDISKSVIKALQ